MGLYFLNIMMFRCPTDVLKLNNNELEGPIPEVGNLTELTFIDLTRNKLSGTIPSNLLQLPNLEFVYLGHNGISGSLPDFCSSIKNSTVLQDVFLNNNQLTGEFPQCVPNSISKCYR